MTGSFLFNNVCGSGCLMKPNFSRPRFRAGAVACFLALLQPIIAVESHKRELTLTNSQKNC